MKTSKSFKLFVASALIILLDLFLAGLWDKLKLGPNKMLLGFSIMISLGISIAGVIYGFDELKQARLEKVKTGLAGNLVLLLLFAFIIILAFIQKK